ncbi:hypothetical protein Hanom_Chr08g00722161 [Helianthus anomalus]
MDRVWGVKLKGKMDRVLNQLQVCKLGVVADRRDRFGQVREEVWDEREVVGVVACGWCKRWLG